MLGGGARMREVHALLAARGTRVPPGVLVEPRRHLRRVAGRWRVGLNSFGPRRAIDIVRAVDIVLPGGDLVSHARRRSPVSMFPGSVLPGRDRQLPPDQTEACGPAVGSGALDLDHPPVGRRVWGWSCRSSRASGSAQIGEPPARLRDGRSRLCSGGDDRRSVVSHDVPDAGEPETRWASSSWSSSDIICADRRRASWRRRPSAPSAGEGMPWAASLSARPGPGAGDRDVSGPAKSCARHRRRLRPSSCSPVRAPAPSPA